MKTVKAGCTAAALLAAMFAVPAMAQSASGSGSAGASAGAAASPGMGTSAGGNAAATGGVSSGTGGSVSSGTGTGVGSGTGVGVSQPGVTGSAANPTQSTAVAEQNQPQLTTSIPVATIPGGAVVPYTPRTAVMGAAGTSASSGTAVVATGPTTVTYSHYFVNVPADVMSRADFQRWMSLD